MRDDFVFISNTHHLGDHTNGNQSFPEAEIIAHDLAQQGMLSSQERDFAAYSEYLKQGIRMLVYFCLKIKFYTIIFFGLIFEGFSCCNSNFFQCRNMVNPLLRVFDQGMNPFIILMKSPGLRTPSTANT